MLVRLLVALLAAALTVAAAPTAVATSDDKAALPTLTNVTPPTITGLDPESPPMMGALVAYEGEWSPRPYQFTYQWRLNGVLSTNTTNRFNPQQWQAGQQLALTVTAHRDGYEPTTYQAPAQTILGRIASYPSFGELVGTPAVGTPLSLAPMKWTPEPDRLSYSWSFAGGDAAPLSTSREYTPTSDDAGRVVIAKVRAHKTNHYTETVEVQFTMPPGRYSITSLPTISGSGVVGTILRATPPTFTPSQHTSITYSWMAGTTPLTTRQSSNEYRVRPEDLGKNINVRVHLHRLMYHDGEADSAPVAVRPGLAKVTSPTITGVRGVGKTLTTTNGTQTPTPTSYRYQWYRKSSPISGATSKTYTPVKADAGTKIFVRVTAAKYGYPSLATNSTTTSIPLYNTARPTISGTKRRGYTLTAYAGSWAPLANSYSYRWFRGTTPISGATARTYKLTSYDVGKRVKVKVTATRTRSASGSAYSYSTTTIVR